MAKKRITRKEIKQPDEFVTFWMRTYNYFDMHRRLFVCTVLGVVLAGALIWGGIAYTQKRNRDSSELLAKAQSLMLTLEQRPTRTDTDAKNSEESPEEILTRIATEYERSPASHVARALLGNRYFRNQQYDKSIELYESLLRCRPDDPTLEALAHEGLAYAYEQKKAYEQAQSSYQKLIDSPVGYLKSEGYFGLARCHETLGNQGKAIDVYRQFIAAYPQHPRAEEAKAEIARLSTLVHDAEAESNANITQQRHGGTDKRNTSE